MHDMTQGPLRGHIARIAAFICFSMVMQTLYALVDLYWVGHLGAPAIAAVSVGSNMMFLVLAGTQALSIGTVALVAQAAGRKDTAAVTFSTAQATGLSLAVGLAYLVLGFAFMRSYANAFAADAHTAQLTVDYLVWFMPSLCLQFLMTAQGSALRGIGNMRLATFTQMGSLALNFALAPVLVLGWPFGAPLGVAGAGLATFISVLAATAFLGWRLARDGGALRFSLEQLRPDFAAWKRILLIGLPAGGEFVLMSIYLLTVFSIARHFGPEAQAGFGVGMRWLQAFTMPALAISFAAAAVAGQNYGAHLHERVRATFREALLQAGVLMLVSMALLQIAPAALMRLLSADPAVIAEGTSFLRIIAFNLPAAAVIFACSGLFQGLGNTMPALIASAARVGLIMSLALWASTRPGFELRHIWGLSVFAALVQAGVCAWFLRREFRRRLPLPVGSPVPQSA
ncbi:MAG TPA: MATE family efflux transporter [Verrucomicrobiae bacterium]|nr:MATE family efflux transporter [Verrucomicrobiae bacterium]